MRMKTEKEYEKFCWLYDEGISSIVSMRKSYTPRLRKHFEFPSPNFCFFMFCLLIWRLSFLRLLILFYFCKGLSVFWPYRTLIWDPNSNWTVSNVRKPTKKVEKKTNRYAETDCDEACTVEPTHLSRTLIMIMNINISEAYALRTFHKVFDVRLTKFRPIARQINTIVPIDLQPIPSWTFHSNTFKFHPEKVVRINFKDILKSIPFSN